MNPPTIPFTPPPQFEPDHLQQIEAARNRMSKIKFACAIAKLDGSCILGFGAISTLCGFMDVSNFFVGVCMVAIGFFELKFAEKLKMLQVGAAKALAINQCALSLLVILYSLSNILAGPASSFESQMRAAGVSDPGIENLVKQFYLLFYVVLIVIAIVLWGGQAYYYYTREKKVKEFITQTPPWLLKMIRDKVIGL